jgi:hypothetical protein
VNSRSQFSARVSTCELNDYLKRVIKTMREWNIGVYGL